MPRGGHSRSGPPPDPNSLRNGTGTGSNGWIALTAPTEPAPAWPLGEPTDAEAALWADLWSRPPASVWPRFHLTRDVATYVRTLLAFERGGHSNAALGALVQRLADQLGLTVARCSPQQVDLPGPAAHPPGHRHRPPRRPWPPLSPRALGLEHDPRPPDRQAAVLVVKTDPFRKANTGRGRRKAAEAVDLRVTRRPRPTNAAPPLPILIVTTEEPS